MPAPRVIETSSYDPEPHGVEKFFSSLGKSYRDKADRDEIGSILKNYEQNINEENAHAKAQLALERSDVSPSKRIPIQERLNEQEKIRIQGKTALNNQVKTLQDAKDKADESERKQQSVYELYKPWMEESEAKRLSSIDNEATARSKIAQLSKKDKPAALSEYEKTLQKEEAKKLIKLEDDIPKAKDSLANLDRIESLMTNNLSGIKGYAKAALNTEAAAEVSSLGLTAIEPILKLFNPVGAIPTQKIKLIQSQFQISPSDRLDTAKGKINALRRMGKQGVARAEARVKLIRESNGKPPEDALQKFDQESESLIDTIADKELFDLKFKDVGDNDLIEGFYSVKTGKKLNNPMTKKEAKKFYDEGLITNVPPN